MDRISCLPLLCSEEIALEMAPRATRTKEQSEELTLPVTETSYGDIPGSSKLDQRLALQVDLHLLTPMLLLNFLSLMGRTNIGAEMIQKLPNDLQLDAMKVFLAITIPLVPLILFEIPSNLLMRLLERKINLSYMRYLSLVTALLGLVTLGQGFDRSYSALLARGSWLEYLTLVSYRDVSSTQMVSMAGDGKLPQFFPLEPNPTKTPNPRSRIFIVEGGLTIAIGLACCYSNVSRPATATFLSEEQKEIIATEVSSRTTTIGLVAEWKIFFSNILNHIWAACYVLTCSTTYSVAICAPSFVKAFHPASTILQIQG
ncbi:hypothetical protein BP5796_12996 [Coleophoma crateriformis]|uniref:Uncharacterized protein n=1 Tax=Coleophoma crateriformis TaxID=565419 RepID=A0A3D8Q529_9HELO|nr:hypothetical protein BP5796_12996 [Coleophoma crateriformis]